MSATNAPPVQDAGPGPRVAAPRPPEPRTRRPRLPLPLPLPRLRRPRSVEKPPPAVEQTEIPLDPDDPLVASLAGVAEPIPVERTPLDTAGVRLLREAGISLVVPLVTSGELVGLLRLAVDPVRWCRAPRPPRGS